MHAFVVVVIAAACADAAPKRAPTLPHTAAGPVLGDHKLVQVIDGDTRAPDMQVQIVIRHARQVRRSSAPDLGLPKPVTVPP